MGKNFAPGTPGAQLMRGGLSAASGGFNAAAGLPPQKQQPNLVSSLISRARRQPDVVGMTDRPSVIPQTPDVPVPNYSLPTQFPDVTTGINRRKPPLLDSDQMPFFGGSY